MKSASARITVGMMSGATSIACRRRRPGKVPRTMATDARVPTTSATRVAPTPTLKLSTVAATQLWSTKNSRYQRSEICLGGNSRNWLSVSEIGTSRTSGITRKATAMAK